MNIKLVTGFRKDQAFSVSTEEAHKAYYLFFNPDARSTFSNGLAIKGSEIERIEPDYQGTMGWNPTHTLDDDDMNEIRRKGVDRQLRAMMASAMEAAKICKPSDLSLTLSAVLLKYPQLQSQEPGSSGGMQRIGDLPPDNLHDF